MFKFKVVTSTENISLRIFWKLTNLLCSATDTQISQMTLAILTTVELMAIHLYLTKQLVSTTAQCSWGFSHSSLLNQPIRQHHCTEHLCLYTHTPVLMRAIMP